jgi:hydrogenase nickel incorporation protein HypB
MSQQAAPLKPRILEVRANVLKKNDELARALRAKFAEADVLVINLVSSPGSGKTLLLRETLKALRTHYRVAALVGDLATDNDATRLAESGAPVKQIQTGTLCHLEAAMVEAHLRGWTLSELDMLFIENVGNLVCPSGYDLGEDLRVALFSTTEGEDKPLKYPTLINTADIALITKIDLAEAVEFDREAMHTALSDMRPNIEIFEVSAKKDIGMTAWYERLGQALQVKRVSAY